MRHKQPFSGSKKSSLPIQHHHYPYWFPLPAAAPQQADTKRGSAGDSHAQPSLSPWQERVTTMISLQHRRKTAMGHKNQPLWATAWSQPEEGAELPGLMGLSRWPPPYPQDNLGYCSMAMKN